MAAPVRQSNRREDGFILIAVIWLLVLGGAIGAILMLRSIDASIRARASGDQLKRKLALEGATETVLADRLFSGVRGEWWLLPAEGQLRVGTIDVAVRLTSESGRLDINEADPALIDGALRGFGISASERNAIIGNVRARRARGQRYYSIAELATLFAAAQAADRCLVEHFTLTSGRAEPHGGHMSENLARAIGQTGYEARTPQPAEAGASLRVEARTASSTPLVTIGRASQGTEHPLSITIRQFGSAC